MNVYNIFLSKRENYFGSAQKIKESSKKPVNIIWIEDFIMNDENREKLNGDVIYFLCNSILINGLIEYLKGVKCYIFNKRFFEKNYRKLEIQNILRENTIKTPRILFNPLLNQIKLPIFCKENKHAGMIFKAYTINTLESFFQKFDIKDFYLEEPIEGESETKYYYVRDSIYSKNNIKVTDSVKEYCIKISKILKLEVFSIDIIKRNNEHIVIDVNPSAGFYMLDEARNKLLFEFDKIKERK